MCDVQLSARITSKTEISSRYKGLLIKSYLDTASAHVFILNLFFLVQSKMRTFILLN